MPLTDAELMQATALAVSRYSYIKKTIYTGNSLSARVFDIDDCPLPPPYEDGYITALTKLNGSYFRLCLITETLLCCTSNNKSGTAYGSALIITYAPLTLFALPSTVTVRMGGVTLTQGTDYSWNPSTGELYISNVTDNLEITVNCTLDGTVYSQCSYIQSAGNEWINTGITGSGTTRVLIDFTIVSNPTGWWGVFGACNYNINRSLLFGIENRSKLTVQSGTVNYSDANYTFALDTHYRVDFNTPRTYVNEVLKTSLDLLTYTTPVPIALFWQNYSSSTNMAKARIRVYSCKIWNGSTLVRDFAPAVRNVDGVAGLFDFVSNTFFVNAGSGAFSYG